MKILVYLFAAALMFVLTSCLNDPHPPFPPGQNIILSKANDSLSVVIKLGNRAIINDEVLIEFDDVIADSRCPINANCIWAGDGEIKIIASQRSGSEELILHTNLEPRFVYYSDYQITLKKLNPYPETERGISKEEYSVELVIKYFPGSGSKSVLIIDDRNSSAIERDLLNINSADLFKDTLSFSLSYSGGCERHDINLFAYKSILKSNPPQVTLILSHDSNNDFCEAYITKRIKFNLTPLKNYLRQTHNIRDKVILLLFDPSGRPLRDAAVEYNF